MPVRDTPREFILDLEAFARKVELDAGVVRRKVSLDLHAKITRKTPVDTGRARGSWFLSDGSPRADAQPAGKGGYPVNGEITATFADPFGASWIANNLPYIGRLEYGHSKQAPAGMVRISLAEIETELATVLEELP